MRAAASLHFGTAAETKFNFRKTKGFVSKVLPHRMEVFSANCPLCNKIVDEIEAGKCAGCQLIVYNLSESLELARNYGVRVVPTVIVDGEIKIEGRPDIPFV